MNYTIARPSTNTTSLSGRNMGQLSRLSLLTLWLFITACADNNMTLYLPTADASSVNVATDLPGDWDQLCVFSSKTITQPPSDPQRSTTLAPTNGDNIDDTSFSFLTTSKNSSVVGLYKVPHSHLDFSTLTRQCFTRSESQFTITVNNTVIAVVDGS